MAYGYSEEGEIHWRGIAKPMPRLCREIFVGERLREKEAEEIEICVLPGQMEDKWIVLCNDDLDCIDFHRSWTGFLVYRVFFERQEGGDIVVHRAIVNRDPEQYSETDDAYDAAILCWLIRSLMLKQEVPYPLKALLSPDDALLAAWSMGGSVAFEPPPRGGASVEPPPLPPAPSQGSSSPSPPS